ncbi:hypothetical protein [Acinetobacter soli]|uniref:hypothetical protein n=1 Tax=Acinetobacter soli TaxID=487316 RepID=UPI00124FF0B0|nr:hypothetical protein [Acinetobacter soli]
MFYKVTSQTSLDAFKKLESDHIQLRENAKKFANEFDADPVVLGDSDRIWFCGIRFRNNSKVNRNIWTKPDRQYGHSWIRTKPLKKEFQAEFNAEKSRYSELYEKYFPDGNTVRKSDFYKTLNLDFGSFFFNSFKCFEHEGSFYIDTTIKMKIGVEILGSEYEEAEMARNAAKKEHSK